VQHLQPQDLDEPDWSDEPDTPHTPRAPDVVPDKSEALEATAEPDEANKAEAPAEPDEANKAKALAEPDEADEAKVPDEQDMPAVVANTFHDGRYVSSCKFEVRQRKVITNAPQLLPSDATLMTDFEEVHRSLVQDLSQPQFPHSFLDLRCIHL